MPKQTWVANYIYQDAEGAACTGVRLITASSEEEAREFAAQNAPSEEFVVSLHLQTDEQLLGSVRQNAARLAELREDSVRGGHALREVLAALLQDPDAEFDELDEAVDEGKVSHMKNGKD